MSGLVRWLDGQLLDDLIVERPDLNGLFIDYLFGIGGSSSVTSRCWESGSAHWCSKRKPLKCTVTSSTHPGGATIVISQSKITSAKRLAKLFSMLAACLL